MCFQEAPTLTCVAGVRSCSLLCNIPPHQHRTKWLFCCYGTFWGGVVVIFAYGFVVFTRTAIIAFFKNVFKNSSLDFRERGKERERELEKYPLVASHMHPDRGSNLQPSCVP